MARYSLPGQVRVSEQIVLSGGGAFELAVIVSRPGVAAVAIIETNQASPPLGVVAKDPPLTLMQLVRGALDPRWRFTISKSFMRQASGLKVVPLTTPLH